MTSRTADEWQKQRDKQSEVGSNHYDETEGEVLHDNLKRGMDVHYIDNLGQESCGTIVNVRRDRVLIRYSFASELVAKENIIEQVGSR